MKHQQRRPDVIEVPIHDLGHRGEGVGRYRGQTIFVQGALPGDTVLARPFELHPRYQKAHLVEVIAASPHRIAPSCPLFPRCGGCQLQDFSYERQLSWKQERVTQVIRRLGGIEDAEIMPIIPAPSQWGYRNKAQFPVQMVEGRPRLGFYEQYSHRLVPAETCLIQHPSICVTAACVAEHLQRLSIAPYDEVKGSGILRHVIIRTSFSHSDVLVTLVSAQEDFGRRGDLVQALRRDLPSLVGVTLNVNKQRGNRILGDRNVILWGKDFIRQTLHVSGLSLDFHISAPSFFQVNPIQAQNLYSVVLEYAQVASHTRLLDAYCGTGTISLVLAKAGAAEIWGIDSVPDAIDNAKENARLNELGNASFFVGRVEDIIGQLIEAHGRPDVVVVDPPRVGLDRGFLRNMANMRAQRWVYVSCNPVTLARDIKMLRGCGYRLKQVQPVDMFPHTAHVECVALLGAEE
ncbi:MAG: 23S rRNA (uracil(1939)-C(5))-methyltransferase RlmD [Limnochordia bacterium]|jgi:23S rRNA (uracil1939-C5)-methyltransferase